MTLSSAISTTPTGHSSVSTAASDVAALEALAPLIEDGWTRKDLGLNRIALGDQRGGVTELRRAADFGETEPQLYVDLGDAELKLGDRASAGRDYNRALLIDPYFAPAHQRLKALG